MILWQGVKMKRSELDQYDWKPAINRITLEMAEVEEVSAGGIITSSSSERRREQMGCDIGKVIGIGPAVLHDFPEQARFQVKVGDIVLIAQHAGKVLPDRNGERKGLRRVINDIDIVAVGEVRE